jgi:hypothetical protein
MEIRKLPIPIPQYSAPSSARSASEPAQQKVSSGKYSRLPSEEEQMFQQTGDRAEDFNTTRQVLLQQQLPQQSHNGYLHDPQLRYSNQQAVTVYKNIASHDENSADAEVLSRIDTLV